MISMSRNKIIVIVVAIVIVLLFIAGGILAWYMLTQQTTGIYIESLPSKTVYQVGDELELEGLVVKESKRIKSFDKVIETEQLTVTGFDSSTVSEKQLITVGYGEYTTSFEVEIQARQPAQKYVKKIEVRAKNDGVLKVDYKLYEILDIENMDLYVEYTDGSSELLDMVTLYQEGSVVIRGYDNREPVENLKVTFTYENQIAALYLNFTE